MAFAANLDVDLLLRGTRMDHVAAGTSDRRFLVLRMDALFHLISPLSVYDMGGMLDTCAHHNLLWEATSMRHPVRTEQPSERLPSNYSTACGKMQGIFGIFRIFDTIPPETALARTLYESKNEESQIWKGLIKSVHFHS